MTLACYVTRIILPFFFPARIYFSCVLLRRYNLSASSDAKYYCKGFNQIKVGVNFPRLFWKSIARVVLFVLKNFK